MRSQTRAIGQRGDFFRMNRAAARPLSSFTRLTNPGNQPFRPSHVVAIVIAKSLRKRALLNVDAPQKRAHNRQRHTQDRYPIAETKSESDECDQRAGVGRMPDETVRAGIDDALFRRDRYIDRKITAQIPDRGPAQNHTERKEAQTNETEISPMRKRGVREPGNARNAEPNADRDHAPKDRKRMPIA